MGFLGFPRISYDFLGFPKTSLGFLRGIYEGSTGFSTRKGSWEVLGAPRLLLVIPSNYKQFLVDPRTSFVVPRI